MGVKSVDWSDDFLLSLEEAQVSAQEEFDLGEDVSFPEDPSVHSTPAPVSLTEEQQQRIELNKQLALEKRLARQKQLGTYCIWSFEHIKSAWGWRL